MNAERELTINSEQFLEELMQLATFSDAPASAVTRILFTPAELAARDYVRQLMRDAGLTITEDGVGNIFGRWNGSQPDLPAISTGSHIDAIPHSGKYDGTVGVLGAIAAIRSLRESGFEPYRSIEVIMFTAEEPTRFGIGCLGSRALAGALTPKALAKITDSNGMTFEEVRRAAGYDAPLNEVKLSAEAYAAFIELHIEQGDVLEKAGLEIGVVSSIAAPAALRVSITGEGGHAGAVLMPYRRDALIAASEIVVGVEEVAQGTGRMDSVATTGLLEVHPGAVNSIPSLVTMEIDIRDTDLDARNGMVGQVETLVEEVAFKRSLESTCVVINADPPAVCDEIVVETILNSAESLGYSNRKMVSRAYHDALFMAQICPTAMLFVPSENGYSHRPEEYTSPLQLTQGIEVLALTLAKLASQ